MMEQVFNPYLPLTEYVPDGEPHVFGDRLYIYGSHDRAGGTKYCEGHYVTWSAPVTNLKDWKYEGVIYRRDQDPSNADDSMQLWAPDVTQGPDGRYYLYYCFSFYPEIGVAVSDSPAGPFAFHGHVRYSDAMGGAPLREFMPFDPAVLTDDDGRVYLYYGFCPAAEKEMKIPKLTDADLDKLPPGQKSMVKRLVNIQFGENSMAVELEPDMLTMKAVPHAMVPGGHHTAGTGFEGHGFFEASSIRKVGDKYYFVYSSHKSHELCYAISDKPTEGYVYGGTIVSNGDIGLNGRTSPCYTLGNNHGGLVQVKEDWYIFYHRPTDGTEFSRQGCAEKVRMDTDGSIAQVEMTSCGLNGGPLAGSGCYPAAIACHVTSENTMATINYNDPVMKQQTRITEHQNVSYVTDIKHGTVLGYKYFNLQSGTEAVLLELRGRFDGEVRVHLEEKGEARGSSRLTVSSEEWRLVRIPLVPNSGIQALYFSFEGEGTLEMKTLSFL